MYAGRERNNRYGGWYLHRLASVVFFVWLPSLALAQPTTQPIGFEQLPDVVYLVLDSQASNNTGWTQNSGSLAVASHGVTIFPKSASYVIGGGSLGGTSGAAPSNTLECYLPGLFHQYHYAQQTALGTGTLNGWQMSTRWVQPANTSGFGNLFTTGNVHGVAVMVRNEEGDEYWGQMPWTSADVQFGSANSVITQATKDGTMWVSASGTISPNAMEYYDCILRVRPGASDTSLFAFELQVNSPIGSLTALGGQFTIPSDFSGGGTVIFSAEEGSAGVSALTAPIVQSGGVAPPTLTTISGGRAVVFWNEWRSGASIPDPTTQPTTQPTMEGSIIEQPVDSFVTDIFGERVATVLGPIHDIDASQFLWPNTLEKIEEKLPPGFIESLQEVPTSASAAWSDLSARLGIMLPGLSSFSVMGWSMGDVMRSLTYIPQSINTGIGSWWVGGVEQSISFGFITTYWAAFIWPAIKLVIRLYLLWKIVSSLISLFWWALGLRDDRVYVTNENLTVTIDRDD